MKYLLMIISFMLFLFLGMLLANRPVGHSRRYLILIFISLLLGILQSIYFFLPPSVRYNIILLLPLKLSFLPLWGVMRYVKSATGFSLVNDRGLRILGLLFRIEILIYLLPLGVIGFMRSYSRSILDYLFTIQAVVYSLFALVAIFVPFQYIRSRTLKDFTRFEGMVVGALLLIGLLVLISVYVPLFIRHAYFLFYLPQVVSAFLLMILTVYDLHEKKNKELQLMEQSQLPFNPAFQATYEQAKQMIYERRLYLNPALRISDVAKLVSLSPNYLSRLINNVSGEGFNDLINRMRVQAVIEKIDKKEYQNKTLYSLACDAGFNSKSTFNQAFKKVTGKTPSEYIKVQALDSE